MKLEFLTDQIGDKCFQSGARLESEEVKSPQDNSFRAVFAP